MIVFYLRGRVSAEKIEEKIIACQQFKLTVFFVGITAGTTVLGAFDPIEKIALVCQKYRIWLHVDVNPFYEIRRNVFITICLGSMGWISTTVT